MEHIAGSANAVDVGVGIAANFELESRVTLPRCPATFWAMSSETAAGSRDRVARCGRSVPPSTCKRAVPSPTENVPASDIDARLDVRMPFERRVHAMIELAQLARIEAEQVRPQFP